MDSRWSKLQPARWAGALLMALALGLAAPARAQTTDVVAQRQDLLNRETAKETAQATAAADLQKAETEPWSPTKIMINLDARCPVVTALGFFGAFATGTPDAQAKFAQLQQVAQPIAQQLMKLATAAQYVGLTFPPALMPQLNTLKGQLYGAVVKIYGDSALQDLQTYVTTQSEGAVVGQVAETTSQTIQ
jgi:hypothetical protein